MAETLKIEIDVSGSGTGGEGAKKAGIKSDQSKSNAEAFWTYDRAKSVVKQFSAQIVNGHINSIGSRTGNYALQERAQTGMSIVKKGIGIGLSFAINPYLGALNLLSEGIGMAFEYAARIREIEWQNREARELARRAGYLADKNR